ncbi:hypothetical protein [Amorphus suaedae]
MPDKSGPNRRAVYDKARKALLKQLQSLDPPLPAQEVTQQRLALEDAIRKLEAEIARAGRTQTPGAPISSNTPAAARTAAPAAPPRPTPPAPPAPPAPQAADARPEAPRATPQRPNFPTAPRAGAEERPAQRPVATPRAPTNVPPRPGASAATRVPPPEGGEAADAQRRREPSLGRPAPPIPDVADVDEIDAAPAETTPPETTPARGAFRRPFGRGDATARAPVAPPEAGPQDDLSEEEIEAAAAEAETPAIAPTADRRGWLRRRGGAAPDPAVDEADEAPRAADAVDDDGYDDEPYEDDGYEGEYDEEPYEDGTYPPVAAEAGRRRSMRWLIAPLVILLVLVVGGYLVYSQRDAIMAMMSPSGDTTQTSSSTPDTTQPDSESSKISDRIGSPTDEAAAPIVAPDARTVKTTRVVTPRNGDAAQEAPLPGTTPAAPAETTPAQAEAPAPAVQPQQSTATSGDFDVVLYEEGASAAEGGNAQRGTISWNFAQEAIGGQPPEPVVRATLEIPARDMTVTLLFRKNGDSALPASHLIEVQFELPSDFPGGSIANVPGLIMKQTEAAQGNALLGASAKVSDNLFWIALSATEADQKQNLELLKTRSWIDIPLLYTSGGRAILTLNKGADGTKAIDEALAAWGGS